jgi:hypothetical protein
MVAESIFGKKKPDPHLMLHRFHFSAALPKLKTTSLG